MKCYEVDFNTVPNLFTAVDIIDPDADKNFEYLNYEDELPEVGERVFVYSAESRSLARGDWKSPYDIGFGYIAKVVAVEAGKFTPDCYIIRFEIEDEDLG